MEKIHRVLHLKRLKIDTEKNAFLYLNPNCPLLKLEGFQAGNRIKITINSHSVIATLHIINSHLLSPSEASVSEYAWGLLKAKETDTISLSYPESLESMAYIRGKIYGEKLTQPAIKKIIQDTASGYLSGIHISSFLTATAGKDLDEKEITLLTQSMVDVGLRLTWPLKMIVDKHCIGGLPGNRTSMILVPIVAAFGLTIPKSSSRAITSSAGTADTMEVLAPVNLSFEKIKEVVTKENGCIVWGGTSSLSPADDVLIAVERELDLDAPGQMVASILSKKIAAGSTHLIIDIPVGKSTKIRNSKEAEKLKQTLLVIGKNLGLCIKIILTDGSQPVGHGIGPALEARDVLKVLQNDPEAHTELRERSLMLAGHILEFSDKVNTGQGKTIAKEILESGEAWKKFQAICHAQGGMKAIPQAPYRFVCVSSKAGRIANIDNRKIARLAKMAGAPTDKAAGVDLHLFLDQEVKVGQPVLTIHAESEGELEHAKEYLDASTTIIQIL